jgi:predicted ester cyclase
MTADQTEAVAHRWHLEVVQAGQFAVADQILAPNVVIHANGQEIRGIEGAKQLATAIHTAFPDAQITHHEALVSGDRVAIRWSTDATHQGEYFGVAPTGKQVHLEGLDLFHFQGGKISELWIEYDNLGVLQQMGAVPTPGQTR